MIQEIVSDLPTSIQYGPKLRIFKVDIDSSDEQGRTVVKPGLDRELDRMKDSYDGLNSLLKQVAIEVATTIPASFDIDVNVIYFPQLGFNIAIPLTNAGEAAYNGAGEEWELIFITENRAYFKDFRMREMDEKLGDIYGLICGIYLLRSMLFSGICTDRPRHVREGNRDSLRFGAASSSV